jgi:hypothetical protein
MTLSEELAYATATEPNYRLLKWWTPSLRG